MKKLYLPFDNFKTILTAPLFFGILLLNVQQSFAQGGGCVCTNCPQFMPDGFVGDFLINVQGADNPTLGQNGQGVCGVNLNFDHEYIGDLTVTLTSPAGQSVTLIGPEGFWGSTDGTSWNIGFVPCGDPANPDAGFANAFNNNQNWGENNSYFGQYYPFAGCLENFNTGPVDGTWTLTVNDGQAIDVGNFYDYEIIFCDGSGIDCFSCEADAGDLTQPNVTACQGSASLNLNLPPTYVAPNVAPPTSEYSYTYVVGGAGGVILAYEPGPDLSGYDPGSYTVCGFSYLTAQEGDIPPPNGSLTVAQLSADLNGGTPPLCGNISGNCVNVTINENPPDEEVFEEICAPNCFIFYGLSYCQTGTYVRNLTTPQGCPFTATLNLTVLPVSITNRIEFICNGDCSQTPGFEGECSPGNYQAIFTNAAGCDSIVNLNLQLLNVVANIVPPGQLDCSTPSLLLSGAGSTGGPSVNYLWTASNGGNIVGVNTNINVTVDAPGDYQLRVCRTGGGITCCDSTTVTVIEDIDLPSVPSPLSGPTSLCQGDDATFTATVVPEATSYVWTVPPGVLINGDPSGESIDVSWNSSSPGQVCVSALNDCGISNPVCITVAITPAPAPGTPQGDNTVCAGAQEAYSITSVPNASGYTWSVTGGTILSGQGTTNIIVDWGNSANGQVCVNATSACGTSQNVCLPVQITSPPASPLIAGNPQACPGGNASYTLANVAGASVYNWTVTGGTILSGQGTDSIVVMWNANAASGIVCANAANVCGASSDQCFNVSLSIPVAGAITHVCDGTNTNYTVSFPVSGGTAPYQIAGGVISNGVFTSDLIISGQPYTFQIVDTNGCVSNNITGVFNCACSTNAGAMELSPLTACEDQSVTATHLGGQSLDANDTTAYILHSGAGTSIVPPVFGPNNSGIFSFQPGMVYGQTYYISLVAGNNQNGFPDLFDPCLSVAQGQPVTFYQIPQANAGLDNDTCALTQFLSADAGIGTGIWTVISASGTDTLDINSPQNPQTSVTASGYGLFTLSWTLNNNGCVDTDTVVLDFNSTPSITGITHTCDGANENYTLNFLITGGTPVYTTSGSPAGTSGDSTFVSDPIPNGGTYSYVVTDDEGCISAPLNGAFSCDCATDAGQMNQNLLSTCEGGSISAQHLGGQSLDANDTVAFVLHTLPGTMLGQIFAQNSTGVFDFQPGMSYGVTYYVSFIVGNSLNGSPDPMDPCFSVTPGQPVVFYQNPVANAGADQSTCGTLLNLSGNAPVGSTGQWTVTGTPAGGILDLGDPNSATSAALASGFGAYTLTWTLAQNGCIGTDEVELQFNDNPVLDDLVRSCDAANENFTVTLTISGGTAPYTVNGQAATGNTFVSGIFVNGQSYTFNVTDANGCSMPQIVGAFSCNCATSAGTMSAQILRVCEGQTLTATASGDLSLDGNDVTAYVLHNGAGPALGQVYAQNTTGTFAFDPAQMIFGTTYYISLVAGNSLNGFPDPLDPCFSVAPGQPVQWLQNPVANAGPDLETCGLDMNLNAINNIFTGAWTLVSGPGTVNFNDLTDPESNAAVSVNGVYVFEWTETNGICSDSDIMNATFNALPDLTALDEICNGTNTEFVVTFTATNGQAPYSVSGLTGTFAGNVFTSLPVPNNASYSFILSDANGCESPAVSGAHNCDCATDAGTMETSPATFCEDQAAVAVWNNDATTDANDLVQFVLHSGSGASLGTIFSVNDQPDFNFGPGLQFGVIYYISAIAGNNLQGNVDLNDQCLSVTPGVPVQWKPNPGALIAGDATICAGGQTVISFSGTGTYPLTLDYSDGVNLNTLVLTGSQTVTLSVSPDATTTFSLINVTDGTLPACATPLSDAATVTVNQPVNAGTALAALELCEGNNTIVQLTGLLNGADTGGQWTETSTTPSQGSAFNAAAGSFQPGGQAAGTYSFRYRLDALAPCEDDETSVTVVIHPRPTADAGQDQTLNCNNLSADLGGVGTSSGTYIWTLNGDTVGVGPTFLAKEGGVYTLWVTTSQGCTDTDVVTVEEDNEVPVADVVSARDVRCFGENNGAVSVDAVSSSHPPVLYSINGGPFGSSPLFTGLAPGEYVITLQDANGCESETLPLVVNEPPQLTADLGGDLLLELADSAHVQLQISPSAGAVESIEWQPLLDSSSVGQPYQHFFPLRSVQVAVTIRDTSGCTARDQILVRVDKTRHVYIPNVFNPSGNDNLLTVYGGRDVVEIESFQIFDRWGEEIYQQFNFLPNSPTSGWDGRIKGQAVPPAVFVYFAVVRFIDGEKVLYKGDVTVVR
jgi:subtilisin-like proprotein convertase family protein